MLPVPVRGTQRHRDCSPGRCSSARLGTASSTHRRFPAAAIPFPHRSRETLLGGGPGERSRSRLPAEPPGALGASPGQSDTSQPLPATPSPRLGASGPHRYSKTRTGEPPQAPVPYTQTLPSSPWRDEPAEAESAHGPPPPLPHGPLGTAGLQPGGRNIGRKSFLPTGGGTACGERRVPSESTRSFIPSRGDRQDPPVTTTYATRYCLNHRGQANPRLILVERRDYRGGFSSLQPRLEQATRPSQETRLSTPAVSPTPSGGSSSARPGSTPSLLLFH